MTKLTSLLQNEPPVDDKTRASLLTGGLPVSLDINDGIHDAQTSTTIITLLVLTSSYPLYSARLGLESIP